MNSQEKCVAHGKCSLNQMIFGLISGFCSHQLIFAYQTQRSNRSVKVQVNYIMDDLIDQKLDDEKILIQVNTFLFAVNAKHIFPTLNMLNF